MPAEFSLRAWDDGRLQVVDPVAVRSMTEAGQVVVEAPEINEFGYGDTLREALDDLRAAVAELYFTLDTDSERLGPDLKAVHTTLVRKFSKA